MTPDSPMRLIYWDLPLNSWGWCKPHTAGGQVPRPEMEVNTKSWPRDGGESGVLVTLGFWRQGRVF